MQYLAFSQNLSVIKGVKITLQQAKKTINSLTKNSNIRVIRHGFKISVINILKNYMTKGKIQHKINYKIRNSNCKI